MAVKVGPQGQSILDDILGRIPGYDPIHDFISKYLHGVGPLEDPGFGGFGSPRVNVPSIPPIHLGKLAQLLFSPDVNRLRTTARPWEKYNEVLAPAARAARQSARAIRAGNQNQINTGGFFGGLAALSRLINEQPHKTREFHVLQQLRHKIIQDAIHAQRHSGPGPGRR
jgi:hypothetical protein